MMCDLVWGKFDEQILVPTSESFFKNFIFFLKLLWVLENAFLNFVAVATYTKKFADELMDKAR